MLLFFLLPSPAGSDTPNRMRPTAKVPGFSSITADRRFCVICLGSIYVD